MKIKNLLICASAAALIGSFGISQAVPGNNYDKFDCQVKNHTGNRMHHMSMGGENCREMNGCLFRWVPLLGTLIAVAQKPFEMQKGWDGCCTFMEMDDEGNGCKVYYHRTSDGTWSTEVQGMGNWDPTMCQAEYTIDDKGCHGSTDVWGPVRK